MTDTTAITLSYAVALLIGGLIGWMSCKYKKNKEDPER